MPRGSDPAALAEAVLGVLPRTDCGECAHPGCRPYAAAVARGDARADACRPGGALTRRRIARLLGSDARLPAEAWQAPLPAAQVARVREADCIGCARCLDACPVDALVGAPRQLHAVLDEDCTGCGLCVPPCPTDCIELGAREPARVGTDAARVAAIVAAGARDCTGCGECAPRCPVGLDPAALHAALVREVDLDRALALRLADCTECAQCDAACPSGIPLAQHFAHGKAVARADAEVRARAARAVAASAKRVARHARRAIAPAEPPLPAAPPDRATLAREVQAAVARAEARRAGRGA